MADLTITADISDLKNVYSWMEKTGRSIDQVRVKTRTAQQQFNTYNQSINRNAREFQRLKASLDPAYAAQQRLIRVQRLLKSQVDAGNISIQESTRLLQQYNATAVQSAGATRTFGRRMNRAGVLTQQAGYQVGDFIVQVQSGTNAFVAFGQQATQVAGTLTLLGGRWVLLGTVLGILIPLVTAVGAALVRTEAAAEGGVSAFSQMRQQLATIEPLISPITSAFSAMATAVIEATNLMVNNLDRIVAYAITAAGVLGARYVAGVVAASVATMTFSGAVSAVGAGFVFLRGAIMRTGIGLLILGIGEAVYQLTRMAEAVGGVGNLTEILGRVAVEVFERMRIGASLLTEIFDGLGMIIAGSFQTGFASALDSFRQFLDTIISGLNVVGSMWPTQLGGPWAIAGGRAALEGLSSGIGGVTEGLMSRGRYNLSGGQEVTGSAVSSMQNLFTDEITSAEELRTALENLDSTGTEIDVRNWFGGGQADSESGGAGGAVASSLEELREVVQSVSDTMRDSMSDAFMSIIDGTKSAKDAFRDMAQAIIRQLYDVLVVQMIVGQFDASTGTGSGLVGAIMGNGGGSFITSMLGLASGGTMNANQPYLVGERGPEIVMPGRQSTVTNANLTRNATSQDSAPVVNMTYNFQGGITEADLARAMPMMVEKTKAAVVDTVQRGGSMARVFR